MPPQHPAQPPPHPRSRRPSPRRGCRCAGPPRSTGVRRDAGPVGSVRLACPALPPSSSASIPAGERWPSVSQCPDSAMRGARSVLPAMAEPLQRQNTAVAARCIGSHQEPGIEIGHEHAESRRRSRRDESQTGTDDDVARPVQRFGREVVGEGDGCGCQGHGDIFAGGCDGVDGSVLSAHTKCMTTLCTATATSSAPPDAFFARWADMATWPEWDEAVAWARLDGPFAAGTTGALKPKGGPKVSFVIETLEPGPSSPTCRRCPGPGCASVTGRRGGRYDPGGHRRLDRRAAGLALASGDRPGDRDVDPAGPGEAGRGGRGRRQCPGRTPPTGR